MPEILHTEHDPDAAILPASARALIKRAGILNWRVQTLRTVVFNETTYMATDATKVKKEAHESSFTWLAATSPSYPLGFVAEWENTSFKKAHVLDPVGVPVELYHDYTPSSSALRQKKDEPEWAHTDRVRRVKARAEAQDAEFNDGASYVQRDYYITTKGEFDRWLDGWDSIINPKEQAA